MLKREVLSKRREFVDTSCAQSTLFQHLLHTIFCVTKQFSTFEICTLSRLLSYINYYHVLRLQNIRFYQQYSNGFQPMISENFSYCCVKRPHFCFVFSNSIRKKLFKVSNFNCLFVQIKLFLIINFVIQKQICVPSGSKSPTT